MSDFRGALVNITKNMSKTSGDFLKTTQLSMRLANEEGLLKGIYIEIGKQVHEIYRYGGSLGQFFDEKYRDIEACEQRINDTKEKLSALKGTRECPKCKKAAEKTAEFCPKCGAPMDTSAVPNGPAAEPPAVSEPSPAPFAAKPPAVPEPPPAPPPPDIPCRVCGATNEPGTKFCLTCGRMC